MARDTYQSALDAVYACAAACDHCAAACLGEPDPATMEACIRLDVDCAELCRTTAGFLARDSDQLSRICAACADICEACGKECDKFEHEHCKQCARACRDCGEQCRRLAA